MQSSRARARQAPQLLSTSPSPARSFLAQRVSWSPWTAITKAYKLRSLHNRNRLSHRPGGWKSEVCQPGWVLTMPFSWACRRPSSCCVLARLPLSLSVLISSSYKDISRTRLGPTNMTSFNLQYCFVGASPGLSGQESASQCRGCKRLGFNPWVGKIPWRRKW